MPRQKRPAATADTPSVPGPWINEDEPSLRWADLDPQVVLAAIEAATALGAGLILGRTSDGGAVSVCILAGDTKPRIYASSVEEAHRRLRQVTEWAMSLADEGKRL